jgi:hypothetical protein
MISWFFAIHSIYFEMKVKFPLDPFVTSRLKRSIQAEQKVAYKEAKEGLYGI